MIKALMINYASGYFRNWSNRVQLLGWALIGILLAMLPPQSVMANGSHINSQVVYSGVVQEYAIKVQTMPIVGPIHLTAYLSDRLTGDPISNQPIRLLFGQANQGFFQQSPVDLSPVEEQPGWYAIDIEIPTRGTWVFSLTIEDVSGTNTVEFPVDILESSSAFWPIIGLIGIVLALTVWIRYRSIKRRKNLESGNQI